MNNKKTGVTRRAVLIGLLFVIALCRVTGYNDYHIFGTWLGSGHFPLGSVFLFFCLTFGINFVLRSLRPGLELRPGELMTVWCMMIVAAGLPDAGLARYFFPQMLGVTYFATPENEWLDIIHPHISDWLIVRDQKAINYFYEGAPRGWGVPWHAWVKPLAFWLPFFLLIWFTIICLSVILRRQWVEKERLTFAPIQLPVEMSQSASGKLNPFFKNRLMWIGFAIPVILHGLNGLHYYFPSVPQAKIRLYLDHYFYEAPWREIRPFWMHILPSVIGMSYLVSLEVSFSIWFFFLLYKVERVLGYVLGYSGATYYRGFVPYREIGGYIVLAGFFIWMAREHLKNVVKAVFTRKSGDSDADEPLPYRWAAMGFIWGILAACLMLALAGANFLAALAVIGFLFVMFIVLTRMVAEGGLIYIQHSFAADDPLMAIVGSSRLSPNTLATLAFVPAIGFRDLRELLMPHVMNAFKVPDMIKISPRKLLAAMTLALVVGAAVTTYSHLNLMYSVSASGLDVWTHYHAPKHFFDRLNFFLQNPTQTNWRNVVFMFSGAGIMLFMLLMRRSFFWWHIHPIGFLLPTVWFTYNIWFSIFIAWLAKFIILRYNGLRGYRRARPLFLGLALGEGFIGGILAIVSWFVGRGYNFLPT